MYVHIYIYTHINTYAFMHVSICNKYQVIIYICVYTFTSVLIWRFFPLTDQNLVRHPKVGLLGALLVYLPESESAKVTNTQYPPLRKKLMLCAFKACFTAAILWKHNRENIRCLALCSALKDSMLWKRKHLVHQMVKNSESICQRWAEILKKFHM